MFCCPEPRDDRELSDGPGAHPPSASGGARPCRCSPSGFLPPEPRDGKSLSFKPLGRVALMRCPEHPAFCPRLPGWSVCLSVCRPAMAVSQPSQRWVASRDGVGSPWAADGTWDRSSRWSSHCGTRAPGEARGGWLRRDSRRLTQTTCWRGPQPGRGWPPWAWKAWVSTSSSVTQR